MDEVNTTTEVDTTSDLEVQLKTLKTRNKTLEMKNIAVSKNYDAVYRQFTLLEAKWKDLQKNYLEKTELYNEVVAERDSCVAKLKSINYTDRLPRHIRTMRIK